ncbi:MAG: iron permease FTR1 [Alphaproteobacteria bacterium CG_4_10_14_0_8_um_filter_53_9]|nr:MAG: iron permease FTR1 [Alphaproteobacteria bacterium CG_4_10_14_0_8_um_filter_53_9]
MENIFTPTTAQAFGILLREGLEALLIFAILAAYVRKAGAAHQIKALYIGAIAAIVASLGLAYVFYAFNNGMHVDALEAVLMFTAAALLFYTSGWLFLKQNPATLSASLKAKAGKALSRNTLTAMASVAFFAVLREGAETVLFFHTLATSSGQPAAIGAGMAGATLVLAAMFFVIQKATLKLPTKPLFVATSLFLFATGLHFVWEGVKELQELALLTFTPLTDSSSLTYEALVPVVLLTTTAVLGAVFHKPASRA